ncbi:MAG: ribonuclease P protein component [Patescibacteria group bacterium]|jgi:ribonuclease P protein component|nr:ribonuclease P protein component [Patescibacteria group bacterium]
MLAKPFRLTKRKDFENIWQKGKGRLDQFLGIKFLANDLENSRFAFIVSLKISKKAVQRNKVKRQLREIIRLNLDKIKPGYDIIINTRPGILKLTYQELDQTLIDLLKKLKLI